MDHTKPALLGSLIQETSRLRRSLIFQDQSVCSFRFDAIKTARHNVLKIKTIVSLMHKTYEDYEEVTIHEANCGACEVESCIREIISALDSVYMGGD